jgi:hypothetical protein
MGESEPRDPEGSEQELENVDGDETPV